MKSVLQKEKECMICKTTIGLHEHHVFEGWGNRAQSISIHASHAGCDYICSDCMEQYKVETPVEDY